jgi:hypothetical protein
MIVMQNQIIGEKLKGLHDSFISLVFKKGCENILCEELEFILNASREVCKDLINLEKKLASTLTEKTEKENDLKQMQMNEFNLKDQLEKFSAKAKERFNYLSDQITYLNIEKEKLKTQFELSETNFKTLAEEYEHLKNKLKQLKFKKSNDDENKDEKICQLCKRLYKESDNYNWSCKVHFSQYSGEIWWCCGKKGESAPGCRTSKHESKEETEEFIKDENLNIPNHHICSV